MNIVKKIKFNLYIYFIVVNITLSLSCYFVEGYKYIVSKSLPASSGILTKDIEPIWNKMMQLNRINNYITFILGIVTLICLLNFMYILGTKNNVIIKNSLLLTVMYLILIVTIGAIAHYAEYIPYGNSIGLFGESMGYIVLIIIIGISRQIFIKLKEKNVINKLR